MQLTFEGKPIDELAVELIRAFHNPNKPLYGAFSGGKDSVATYNLCERAEANVIWHYNQSPIDPPEIPRFIRQHYPKVIFVNNSKGFFNKHFMSHGLPLRKRRWCCEIIKESGGDGDSVKIMGMRSQESKTRRKYKCWMPDSKMGKLLLPIVSWTTDDVWQYIAENNLPICELYRCGFKRIGCLLCPNAGKDEIKMTLQRYPNLVRAYKSACERYIKVRIERGTPLSFKTGEEYFNWWIKR